MKTKGQILYEWRHPKYIKVYTDAFKENQILIENPEFYPSWKYLTKECQSSYEREAKTHYITYNIKT